MEAREANHRDGPKLKRNGYQQVTLLTMAGALWSCSSSGYIGLILSEPADVYPLEDAYSTAAYLLFMKCYY